MKLVVREMHIAHITYLFISSKGLQLNRISAQKPPKQIEAAPMLYFFGILQLSACLLKLIDVTEIYFYNSKIGDTALWICPSSYRGDNAIVGSSLICPVLALQHKGLAL